MSIDVGGWIEVRTPGTPEWKGIERLRSYIDRANGMLECLFGIRSRYGVWPVAPGRGVPADASPEVRADVAAWSQADVEAVNWITWAEIASIDWDEQVVSGYRRYIRTKRGALVPDPAHDTRRARERLREAADRLGGWPEGSDELEVDGAIYRRELESRGAVKTEDWQLLFAKLEKLAVGYGPDGVRIVVWLVA
jgi:hypothetical protein